MNKIPTSLEVSWEAYAKEHDLPQDNPHAVAFARQVLRQVNADRKKLEEVVIEASNLLAFETFETPEARRENSRSERGRTVNALYYAIKALYGYKE